MSAIRNTILAGDATTQLKGLPKAGVDCVITSPPYFQLRDYQANGQLGLEATVEEWVANLRAAFEEVARVLKPSGSLWLDLGDTYSRRSGSGAPRKSLLLAPERLLLALAGDGWLVRNKVIWAKTNPMPSSVTDRLSVSYDVVYFLVRQPTYFFDLNAIRQPHTSHRTSTEVGKSWPGSLGGTHTGLDQQQRTGRVGHWLGKNPGDVWSLPGAHYRGAHFATFPPKLVERPLLATCPEAICTRCHQPWIPTTKSERFDERGNGTRSTGMHVNTYQKRWRTLHRAGPLQACGCNAPTRPGLVLDPFLGSGTVGEVAEKHGRDWLGIELSKRYRQLAWQRIRRARGERGGRTYRRERPISTGFGQERCQNHRCATAPSHETMGLSLTGSTQS